MTKTKREKFTILAEKRVTDVLKKLQTIGNLSNKNNYDFTDDQVKQIIDTLKFEIEILEEQFQKGVKSDIEFKFK